MAFLSGKNLENELKNVLGTQFNSKRVKQLAYELSLGGEVFLTDSKDGKPEILDEKNKVIEINPGQFALLLSEEKISMPADKLGLISIKASEKLKGLLNVSGFHVDPGFNGQLLFSVYNAGPSKITLKKGNPYFLIWFAEITESLDNNELYNSQGNGHQNQDGIHPKYLDSLKRGELASPNVLLERIKSIKSELERHWWAIGIILVVAIATCTRFYWQKSMYEKGFNDGYSKNEIEKKVNEKIQLILNKKMDSIISSKTIIIKDTLKSE
ncbi:deoxycytidine triphosphate deaminase [Allomuricauda sp.]|uniref:dCTP deaminase domain-containing protein n=1 Tax=Flagellimonas alginolytica TaxID=3177515 RepID=UPI0025D1037F|nr:deoxycytidine triphosphate deaminase [Allomuricauda sp.]